jgi:hypothetical protein
LRHIGGSIPGRVIWLVTLFFRGLRHEMLLIDSSAVLPAGNRHVECK